MQHSRSLRTQHLTCFPYLLHAHPPLHQAAAPSLGIGRIKARDNPALYGTDREYTLRTPDDPFYKRFSAEASRFQVWLGRAGWQAKLPSGWLAVGAAYLQRNSM